MTGRPRIIETPEEFERLCDEYFQRCSKEEEIPTVAGLAYFLGFESRQSMWDYGQREGFSYCVKKAKLYLESRHEASLDKQSCVGHIFWLKNHGGYSDRQEISGPEGSPLLNGIKVTFVNPDAKS